jgi:carboxypeptidase family protein
VLVVLALAWLVQRAVSTRDDSPPASRSHAPSLSAKPLRPVDSGALTPPAASPREPFATGRVLDRGGHPIAGARVVSHACDIDEVVTLGDDGRVTRAATTDASGRFEIGLRGTPESWSLVAEAPGFSPWSVDDVAAGSDVRIVLDHARTMFGTVMDDEGKPVVGAQLRWSALVGLVRVERRAASGDDGGYRIADVPTRRAFDQANFQGALLEAKADGYPTLVLPLESAPEACFGPPPPLAAVREEPGGSRHDVVLTRGVTVRGRVVDAETREPLAGARVHLGWPDADRGFWSRAHVWVTERFATDEGRDATAADDGSFEMSRVRPSGGVYGPFRATAPEHVAGSTTLSIAQAGAAPAVEIACWPVGIVRGRVVDADGAPRAGARVSANSAAVAGEPWQSARFEASTDAQGHYEIEVAARRAEPTSIDLAWFDAPRVHAQVRAGETADAPDLVHPSDRLAIVLVDVVDSDGKPLRGASVAVEEKPGAIGTRTDASGRARLEIRLPDRRHAPESTRYYVGARGFAPTLTPSIVPSADAPSETRVVLQPGHRLAGRVEYADGSPAAGARVRVANGAAPLDRAFRTDSFIAKRDGFPLLDYGADVCAEDGSFELRDLPEAPYHLRAEITRAKPGTPFGKYAEAEAEDVATDASNLVLVFPPEEPRPEMSAVEGVATDATTGEPLAVAWASLEMEGTRLSADAVPPNRFRFPAVPFGTWTLRVAARDHRVHVDESLAVDATRAAQPIAVALERGAVVHGVVRGLDGADPGGWQLSLEPRAGSDVFVATLGKDGSYSITGVGPDGYAPCLRPPSYSARRSSLAPPRPREIVVEEGASDVAFDFDVVSAGRLLVQVTCDRLPPFSNERPATDERKRTGAASRVILTDADGSTLRTWSPLSKPVLIAPLPPGRYSIRVEVSGAEPQSRAFAIAENDETRVTFDVP